ncbi:MAG: dihydroorotase [Flavobacteriales bacterium]|nr:dihydroorotase [Flavobacteriales bacterium]
MILILRHVTVIDPRSPHHLKKKDIYFSEGRIKQIGENLASVPGIREVSEENLCISPGFTDFQVTIGEPGREMCETLDSASQCAIRGGITTLCMLPSTQPPIDNRTQVEFIVGRNASLPVTIYPLGALTVGREGKEMAELLDMAEAGITVFTDGKRNIENPKLFELILQYAKNRNLLVVHHADTPKLTQHGIMHEGDVSTRLGLKGFPAIAEEMAIQRDLYILEYTGGRLHIPIITTWGSVELIRKAKLKGLQVTCGTAPQYLLFTDDTLESFDPLFKVNPPYRNQKDIEALLQGLSDGTIDVLCSDHTPVDDEHKNHELEHAEFGITNLETFFAAARTATNSNIDLTTLVEKISINPSRLLGINLPIVREGEPANFTLYHPHASWTFDVNLTASLSKNTPFHQYTFKGKPYGIITTQQLYLS